MGASGSIRNLKANETRAFQKTRASDQLTQALRRSAHELADVPEAQPDMFQGPLPGNEAIIEPIEGRPLVDPDVVEDLRTKALGQGPFARHKNFDENKMDPKRMPKQAQGYGQAQEAGPGYGQEGEEESLTGNLAENMSKEDLSELGGKVRRHFDIDEGTRADWLEGYEKALELVNYASSSKTYPIEASARLKYPLLTTASLQFAARAYPAIVKPGNGSMVRMRVEGIEVDMPAPEMAEQMDPRELQMLQIKADKSERASRVSRYLSWLLRRQMKGWEGDTDKMLHRLPLVGCEFRKTFYDAAEGKICSRLVAAKNVVIDMAAPSLDEAPRISECYSLYKHELNTKIRAGIFLDIRDQLAISQADQQDDQAPIEFIEQCCRCDLDGDGYEEPVIVTVERNSGIVARIERGYDDADVKMGPNGDIVSINPTPMWTKYDFLPNVNGGVYGIGFGHVLRDLVEAINASLNQIVDAGHLQNASGGFIGRGLRFGRGGQGGGQVHVAHNRWHVVNAQGGDIRGQIVPFDHKGPSPVLFEVLGMLIDAGRDLAGIKDVLTGEASGATMPVGTTLALIEQGMQVFSALYKRIYRSMSEEFQILFSLAGKHMDEQTYLLVTDDPKASLQDFSPGDHDIEPMADPNGVTDMQKLGRAQFLQQFLSDPLLNRQAVYTRMFKAANIEDIEALWAPPDMQAAQMAQIQMLQAQGQTEDIFAAAALKDAQARNQIAQAAKAQADAATADVEAEQRDRELDIREEEVRANRLAAQKGASRS